MNKILLAEDEFLVAELTKAVLSRDGYDVITARDGAEALKLLDEVQPDLIIADRMMPRVDGIMLCQTIRKDTRRNSIPIIFMSAAAEPAVYRDLYDHFIAKPFDVDELLNTVRSLLHPA